MKILFFGYSAMGYHGLKYFLENRENVVGIVTHRDKEEENQWFPSVSRLGESYNVPVHFAEEHSKEELKKLVSSLSPDMIFSIYFRNLIPGSILKMASKGAFNLHGSLLPKYRGRCPTNWQVLMGEPQSGVTLHVMERRVDRGAIVGQQIIPMDYRETAASLGDKQVRAAAALLKRVFPLLKKGEVEFIPQDNALATTFGGRRPEDGEIHWEKRAIELDRLVRAVTHPFPGAYSHLKGKKVFVWSGYPLEGESPKPGEIVQQTRQGFGVATGEGFLEILRVQMEGDEEMDGQDFWEKYGLQKGQILGTD